MNLTYPGVIKYLPVKKANRIVIAELMEKPGYAETLIVSDDEEDFVPVMSGMIECPAIRTVSKAIDVVARLYEGFPISEVTISHSKMTAQEAYSVIMGKSVNIPPRKVLRKRRLQWLYLDCSDEAWKRDAEKHWQKEFGCEEPLWDGSESVFQRDSPEEERHEDPPHREPVIVKVRRKMRHSRNLLPPGKE